VIPFVKTALPASFSGSLTLAGYTDETVYREAGDTATARLFAFLSAPLTAGTVTVTAKKNGSTVGTVSLAVGTPLGAASLTALGLREGDRLEVSAVSSADLAPVTATLVAIVD
jgi:hypothetical protein